MELLSDVPDSLVRCAALSAFGQIIKAGTVVTAKEIGCAVAPQDPAFDVLRSLLNFAFPEDL